jgi:hypothetical protein
MAPVNLTDPSWTVRQGQALWRPNKEAPEIAGELLVAFNHRGSAFLQFTKTPLPFVIAHRSPGKWQIESALKKKSYRGPGRPPSRISWFILLERLEKGTNLTNSAWSWHTDPDGSWQMENKRSGERLEGFLQP